MGFMLSLKKNPDLPFVISDKAANPPTKKEKLTPVSFCYNDEVYRYLQDKAVVITGISSRHKDRSICN